MISLRYFSRETPTGIEASSQSSASSPTLRINKFLGISSPGLVDIRLTQTTDNYAQDTTLIIPFQNPILNHVTPDGGGVIVELGNDRVEVFLGVSGGWGELLGNSMKDCDPLDRLSGD